MYAHPDRDTLKRKFASLSPPPEVHEVEAEAKKLRQATQVDWEVQAYQQAYSEWSGRGRSPFKTPATAAIDGLKTSARFLEAFEREIAVQQYQLDALIAEKKARLIALHHSKSDLATDTQMAFQNAPIFPEPKTPASRSLSPSKYLAQLATGTPPIIHRTLEESRNPIPESVSNIVDLFEEDLELGCMPIQFKDEMQKLQPNIRFNRLASRNAFGGMEDRSRESVSLLWAKAKTITEGACFCAEKGCDESRWSTRVIMPAMDWENPVQSNFSQAEFIQTQSISKSCLQTPEDTSLPAKKADWALAFSPLHPDVQVKYDALKTPDGVSPSLSQMNDVYTSTLALYLGAEVKKFGGNEVEAQGQCFQWLGAGIKKMRNFIDSAEETLPLLGWVIVGHRWELYMAIGVGNEPNDEIIVFGPIGGCTTETRSYFGVFKLLRLMERVKEWARKTYWPWYCKAVIKPLEGRRS